MASDLPQNNQVTDNAQAQHQGIMSGATDWVSNTASDLWSATKGGATVVGQVAWGAGKEVYDHPLKTAGEVAAAAGIAVCLTEAGITGTAAAAVAAVPVAGYGIYRGGQIAATEGVGAIPEHMKQTWDEGKQYVGRMADAAATVYNGGSDASKMADAKEQLQQLGYDAAPLAAAGVGAASSGILADAAKVGVSAAGDLFEGALRPGLLPALSLEPAYAAASATAGGAARALANKWEPGLGADQPQVLYSIKDKMTTDFNKRSFVDGKGEYELKKPLEKGFAAKVIEAFKEFGRSGKDSLEMGNMHFTRLKDGWHEVDFVKGESEGTTAQYDPRTGEYIQLDPSKKPSVLTH